MGNQRQYIKEGGFSEYLYETLEKHDAITINGLTAKVIKEIGDVNAHSSLPSYSNTSDMYFKEGPSGDIIQCAYYGDDRRIRLNFDWGHDHYNDPKKGGDGERFEKGLVHVQQFTTDEKGKIIRLNNKARLMTEKEIEKFGDIIKHFNPSVKFKP